MVLILALLMALPAAAMPACHEATPAAVHVMPHEQERVPEAAPTHACLGCVPLGDWLAAPIAIGRMAPAAVPAPRIATLDLGRVPPPLLRPPRLG